MKRALLKQMRHEWRDNIWIVIGLTLVCGTVWFMTLSLASTVKGLFYPMGVDTENVYQMSITFVPASSPDYINRGDEQRAGDLADLRTLIANVRRSPYVEAAAFSENGLPYSYSYNGISLATDTLAATSDTEESKYYGNCRKMSPDMVRVLKLESLTGKSQNELEQLLREGQILVTNVLRESKAKRLTPEEINGKTVYDYVGEKHRVGDVIRHIKRSDFDLTSEGGIVMAINEDEDFHAYAIAIRVKPGTGEDFRKEFEKTPSMQRQGNIFLHEFTSMSDKASTVQRRHVYPLRMTLGLSLMLVIIVGLGVMGVFWFRIQQRVSETAIRKVCGASKSDISRRIISEGLILLALASVLMAAAG